MHSHQSVPSNGCLLNRTHGSRFRVVLGTLAALLLIASCADPVALMPKAEGNTGTLSVSVPHIAGWASQATAGATAPLSRAYMVADGVRVEVKNSKGADVVPPTTIALAMGTDYFPAYPVTPSNLAGIPVGSGYTVKVSVYNYATSTTTPMVSGQATGISVTSGGVTPINIICLPVAPTPVTPDAGPWTEALAPNGEHWYSLAVTTGKSYYMTNNCPFAIFNSSGAVISTNGLPYTATYTGTIYIGVVNFDGIYNFTAQASSVLTVSMTEPVTNEGTLAAPALLTPDSRHVFHVGPSSGTYGSSYYKFTTTAAGGDYGLDTELQYFSAGLFSDSKFSSPVSGASQMDYGLPFVALAPSTTYYLKLTNNSSGALVGSGQVMSPGAIGAATQSQGSISNPVVLVLGVNEQARVGNHYFDQYSYYRFTTGADVDHSMEVSGISPSSGLVAVDLFSDPNFSSSLQHGATGGNQTMYQALTPSTTYYLRISNRSMSANLAQAFGLRVMAQSGAPAIVEGSQTSPVAVALNTPHTFGVGAYGSGYSTSYYRFTTSVAGTYAIDTEIGSMSITLYSDSGYRSVLASAPNAGYGMAFPSLAAGTTYYFTLVSNSGAVQSSAGQIVDPVSYAANSLADGSPSTPIPLTVGAASSGRVGNHSYDSASYYRFTTGTGVDYSVTVPQVSPTKGTLMASLFSDSTFSNNVSNQYFTSGSGILRTALVPNTPYYVKVSNMSMTTDTALTYSVNITADPVPTFHPLTVSNSFTEGSIEQAQDLVWYQVPVVAGTTYAVAWDDRFDGSGAYNLDIAVSAYQADRVTPYFTAADAGYQTPKSITVPVGQTKVYLLARAWGGTGTTGTFRIKID